MFKHFKFLLLTTLSCLLLVVSSHGSAKESAQARVTQVHSQTYNVASDGTQYTIVNPGHPLALTLHPTVLVDIDGGATARVKSWEVWLKLKSSFAQIEFKDHSKTKSYSAFNRPKSVYKTISDMSIPEDAYSAFFIQQCNSLANRLKQNNGYTNKQIFSQDRVLEFYAQGEIKVDFTANINLGQSFIQGYQPPLVTVVCNKWQGPQHNANVGLAAEETVYVVTDSSLTVSPQSTVGGACNVTLSGVIKTLKPNVPVKFKYRHQDGHTGIVKDSQVYEVTTDHSKTAMFSHQFDIQNLEGQDEHGTLQLIGVSPEFHTKKKLYELACSKPSPNELTTNLGPEASAYYLIQERVQVGNQSCPVKVRLVGTIKTHGARRGKAIFVGDHYLSNAFTFDLAENSQQQFIADRTIDWDLNTNTQQGASHIAQGNTGGNALRFKDIRFSFNVSTLPAKNTPTTGGLVAPTTEEYTLAVSTAQRHVRLQCEVLDQSDQNLSLSISDAQKMTPSPKTKIMVPAKKTHTSSTTMNLQSNNKADITVKALNIAGNSFNKSSMMTLNATDAIRFENGRCLFDFSYSIENKGQATSSPFKIQVTQDRVLINQHQNVVLKSGELENYYRVVGLKTGMNTLRVDVDTDISVTETNKNNNHLVKKYNVLGRCQDNMQLNIQQKPTTAPNNHIKPAQQREIMLKH